MNILVTGANGQLGNEMQIVSRASGDKYIFTDVCDGYQKLDITDLDAVVDFVNANDIRCIINCAAWTNVDGAEDPAKYPLVEALNAKAPENLAIAMRRVGGLLVHVSTDYVFGGDPYNIPCKEDQKGTPTGVYGATKLRGEQNIINVMGAPPAPMWGSCQDGAANVDANSQQPSMWGSCQDGAAIVDANSQQPSMLGSCQDGAAIVDANSQQPSMLGSPEVCATPSGKSISYNLRPTFNADPVYYVELKKSAKYNRNHPTEAERLMWDILSGKQLEGYKFRRQHIIGQYIADFACLQEKLVIEIDGGYHNHPDQKYYDEIRSSYILSQGYRIIRFTNKEVFSSLDKVIAKIISELEQHTHTDSAPSKLTSGEEHPHMGAGGAITNVDHPSITEAGNKEAKLTSGEEHPHMGAMGAEVPSGEEHPHMGAGGAYLILRTAWLYSEFGKNFVKTMLNLTATKPQLKVVFDQTGTPTYAYDLASAIFDIVENRKYEGNSGIYHYSNEGVCSWYDFTKMIAEYSGHTACDIQPCHSNEFPSPVKRPAYSVLDKTKIKQTFGTVVPYWTDSLRICLERMKSNR